MHKFLIPGSVIAVIALAGCAGPGAMTATTASSGYATDAGTTATKHNVAPPRRAPWDYPDFALDRS